MDDDILRQRRNLIAMSSVLILFDFADVKIAKVGILGTDLIVGSPEVIVAFAWVIWAYLLLRYYQYWRKDQRSLFAQTMYDAVRRYAFRYSGSKKFKDPHNQKHNFDLKQDSTWRLRLTKDEYQPKEGRSVEIFSLPVPMWRAIYWKIKAFLHFVIHTPHFTDHILPFALAFAAPIITVITHYKTWVVGGAA